MGNLWVLATHMSMGMGTKLYPHMGMGFLVGKKNLMDMDMSG
jgi:hypothetical protein